MSTGDILARAVESLDENFKKNVAAEDAKFAATCAHARTKRANSMQPAITATRG